jgi:ribosomal RNA assembly protein
MYVNHLKVSKNRLGEIIGRRGSHKKDLEKLTNTKIKIFQNGEIEISGEDSYAILQAKQVLEAIDCGFRYEEAKKIITQDYVLDLVDLKELKLQWYHNKRILGRVIGRKGLAKETIERLTGAKIVVNEENLKIGILGYSDDVYYAKEAVLEIVRGTPHGRVFKRLEKIKQERERDYRSMLWKPSEGFF